MQISELTTGNRQKIDSVVDTHLTVGPEYMDMVDHWDAPLVFTRDTLYGFLKASDDDWREVLFFQLGPEYIVFRGAQVKKYQPRRDIAIVDCGDFRVVIEDFI